MIVGEKITLLNKVACSKSAFIKHAMYILVTIASMSFSNLSMASTDEDLKQEARERHEQHWNDNIDHDLANEIVKCGEIYFSLNREIKKYNEMIEEYERYEHGKSDEAGILRELARGSVLRLEDKVHKIGQQYKYSCEEFTSTPNIPTMYLACQSRGVQIMLYEMCGEAYTTRDELDEKFR